jgi:hypothetical protein
MNWRQILGAQVLLKSWKEYSQQRLAGGMEKWRDDNVLALVSLLSFQKTSLRKSCLEKTLEKYSERVQLMNSVALVCERSISTERPPLVGEVSANSCGFSVLRDHRDGSPTAVFLVFYTGAATFSSK